MNGTTIAATPVSDHARRRMQQRGIRPEAVKACLDFGRRVYSRGALFLVMGRREVASARRAGIRLDSLLGLQVLVRDGTVVTVYRNPRLLPRHDDRSHPVTAARFPPRGIRLRGRERGRRFGRPAPMFTIGHSPEDVAREAAGVVAPLRDTSRAPW
jgi:hypothetical protein